MSGYGLEGFGSVTWWGFSPALDLAALATGPECANVLVVGSGDLRHVLTTLAHSTRPLHFYVAESSLELLARHMIFLSLITEPLEQLGLQERSELFLELYGNTLIRPHTAHWLRDKATQLIRMMTDLDYLQTELPILDLSLLKFRERDLLEGIFKFWRLSEPNTFDIQRHWEGRLRHHLGVRYDSRSGVFDWDYNMKLHDLASIVSGREYQAWRESGVAFQLRDDAPYQHCNRTLASGHIVKQGGERVARRGYWGDIVNSPYLSLGLQSDNKDLFKTTDTRHVKSSVDVSVWNTQCLLGRLLGVDQSRLRGETERSESSSRPATIEEVDEEEEEEDCETQHHSHWRQHQDQAEPHQGLLFNGTCSITFLPLNSVPDLSKKPKFKNLFDVVYFSNSMVHHLSSGVEATFSPHCTLILETARFMLDLRREQRLEYIKKVTGMASAIGYTVQHHSAAPEDANFLAFSHSEPSNT